MGQDRQMERGKRKAKAVRSEAGVEGKTDRRRGGKGRLKQ